MGTNIKILTKRDSALIWRPFDSACKNKQECPGSKVVSGLFWALSWLFWPHFLRYRLQICYFGQIFAKFLAEMGSKFFGGLNQKSESFNFSRI